MKIKLELLRGYIADEVKSKFNELEIDANKIVDTKAIIMLREIQAIIQNENMEPEDMVEAISNIFLEQKIDGAWWVY